MLRNLAIGILSIAVFSLPAFAQEYNAEKIESDAPADEISGEIAAL
jgi:hypothetical protein